MTDREIMLAAGGKPLITGGEPAWYFGWIPSDDRAEDLVQWIFEEENDADVKGLIAATDAMQEDMPDFKIEGVVRDVEKAFLWESWKDPKVIAATDGALFTGTRQATGACVGCAGGSFIFTLAAHEVARLGDLEAALIPFWLIPYGRSRYHSGIRGRGDGSTGTGFAKAMLEDGIVPANLSRLPPYDRSNMIFWGGKVEMDWSDGAKTPAEWLEKSRIHLVKSAARVRSADGMRDALLSGYSGGFCGMWGGLMKCEVRGTPPVLMNRRTGQWAHQQSCLGVWDHPTEGLIFYILNQWGLDAHGRCPSGAPAGGYWIGKADMDWQCRNGECIAYSAFNGFPAVDWDIPWIFGSKPKVAYSLPPSASEGVKIPVPKRKRNRSKK